MYLMIPMFMCDAFCFSIAAINFGVGVVTILPFLGAITAGQYWMLKAFITDEKDQ